MKDSGLNPPWLPYFAMSTLVASFRVNNISTELPDSLFTLVVVGNCLRLIVFGLPCNLDNLDHLSPTIEPIHAIPSESETRVQIN